MRGAFARKNAFEEALDALTSQRRVRDVEEKLVVLPGASFSEAGWWFPDFTDEGGYAKLFKDCNASELLDVVKGLWMELGVLQQKQAVLERRLEVEKALNNVVNSPALSLLG